jgi:hypothetical protein
MLRMGKVWASRGLSTGWIGGDRTHLLRQEIKRLNPGNQRSGRQHIWAPSYPGTSIMSEEMREVCD